jgi:dephospho-CoA kinase
MGSDAKADAVPKISKSIDRKQRTWQKRTQSALSVKQGLVTVPYMTRILGLTGGIGSGKSSVARILENLGAKIIDADKLARDAVAPESDGLGKIRALFGDHILTPEGQLDRQATAKIVFSDAQALASLNAIIHPEVQRLAVESMRQLMDVGASVIIYDVPLLYENGLEKTLPEVIVVHVPPDVQRERVRTRDGLSDTEITARIEAQANLDEKAKKADYLIDNRGTRDNTVRQVQALWAQLNLQE